MLGNDIVDLSLAKHQSNWKRQGYLHKIFTVEEQRLIHLAIDPNQMVWLLWSMKEAAYKIHNRKTGIREYAPLKLACGFTCSAHLDTGKVCIDESVYFTHSNILVDYIHTWATSATEVNADIRIYEYPINHFDYKATKPSSVSHHGRYLALVY